MSQSGRLTRRDQTLRRERDDVRAGGWPPLLALVAIALLPAATGHARQAAPTVDGFAAIVNEEVISIGEVRRAALLAREGTAETGSICARRNHPAAPEGAAQDPSPQPAASLPGALTRAELEDARECLIDMRLVFREVRRFPRIGASAEQVDSLFRQFAEQFESPRALSEELRRLGTTTEEMRQDLRRQLLITEYVDGRFRATATISDEQARAAWEEEFAPGMRAAGVAAPEFEAVADSYVVPILLQREVNRRVQSWIVDLRQRATIRRLFP